MNVPTSMNAGDKIEWTESLSDYPASSWNLAIEMRGKDLSIITVTASANNNDFDFIINPDVSKGWKAGTYNWQCYAFQGNIATPTDRKTIWRGTVEVNPNLYLQTASDDQRSHVKRTLDILEAVIEGKASSDSLSYSIAGRSINKMSPTEILEWRDLYRSEYKMELDKEKTDQGIKSERNIGVRFNRV